MLLPAFPPAATKTNTVTKDYAVNGTGANQTTSAPGGVVYSNNNGQYTAAGPGGIVVSDGTHTTTVNATSVTTGTVTATTGNFTTLNAKDSDGTSYNVGNELTSLNARTAANSAAIAGLKGDVRTLYKLNAMAVAMPDAYLNEHERFSLAGGVGFAGDEYGIGVIGSVRFDKNWSGYGGAAFSNGEAVGKVGARVGW